jgi:hypothetical protein
MIFEKRLIFNYYFMFLYDNNINLMLLIPKKLVDRYFAHKYEFYKQRDKYKIDVDSSYTFDYYLYRVQPAFYQNLVKVCNEIKENIKSALESAIGCEENENLIKNNILYYKLTIRYAYNHEGIQFYETSIMKTCSILRVYYYLLFDSVLENELRLLDAWLNMQDCFNVSKLTMDNDIPFYELLWCGDSFKISNINIFAEYDEVLRDRWESIVIEMDEQSGEMMKDIALKYPKTNNDKEYVYELVNTIDNIKNEIISQLINCETEIPIEHDDSEYYDLMYALERFFSDRNMRSKIRLEKLNEDQVYVCV